MEQATLFPTDGLEIEWFECRRCRALGYEGFYPRQFFGTSGRRDAAITSRVPRRICLGCDEELNPDRLLRRSLGQRIRTHAKRLSRSIEDMHLHGMTTDAFFVWFKRKWASGVLDCGCLTSEMHHGWRDAEVDLLDPEQPPFFPANWQLTCANHNRSKGRSSPADFAARQRGWALFKSSRVDEAA